MQVITLNLRIDERVSYVSSAACCLSWSAGCDGARAQGSSTLLRGAPDLPEAGAQLHLASEVSKGGLFSSEHS